ncbi:MAG: transglutaminase domain-containing protein [Pseudomonadales bacterium]|nr:transglutaminase domain-containing protein [Pseudomonadales bacterium]
MMNQASSTSQFLPGSVRAVILATSYWVLSIALTTVSGSTAAFAGCLLGCLAIDSRIQKPPLASLRLPALMLACLLLILAGQLLAGLVTDSTLLTGLFGAMTGFQIAESLRWFLLAMGMTMGMRLLAHRTSYGRVLEILFVASAFVITLSAHRQGMINRPFFIGDFALVRGIDPTSILMATGCAAVLSLAALLIMEKNHRRLPYHFGVLGLLCFSLLVYIQFFGLPTPQVTDTMGLTGQAGNAASGQSNNPFSDGENDFQNREAPVAIVLFRDDYEPEGGAYYFRESAYSQFNGSMLDYASSPDLDQDLIEHFTNSSVAISEPLPASGLRRQVRTSIGLLTPHRNPFGLDTPVSYTNTPNPNSTRFKQTYDVVSEVPQFDFSSLTGHAPGAANWTLQQWQEYLEMPDDPRYQELASSLLQSLRPEFADDPYAKALVIKSYLDENGTYSLKNDHAYAGDPAGSFLFGDMTGYCMHFAFSATYLYRSIGIPARVGIGYSVPAANRAGGSALLIQAIHGHAWPEIYLRDIGWVIVDPAPSRTLVDMSVDPQDGLQQMLGDMLRDEAAFEEFMSTQQGIGIDIQVLVRTALLLLLAALLSAYLIRLYRLLIPLLASDQQLYRLAYRAELDRLAAAGITRRHGETREEFANRVGDLSPSFREMTRQHLLLAMGREHTEQPGMANSWLLLRKKIRTELGSTLPWWQRLLALINPVSWLSVH